jgi:hypothetical protein
MQTMQKKTSSRLNTNNRPNNKSAFVRGLVVRSSARRETRHARPASGNARAKASAVNKSAFVRGLPGTLSAAEVIARGKTKGIRLSAAQVYTIRANARRKGPSATKTNGRTARAKSSARSVKLGRGVDAREAEFIAAALDLGLTKAEALIAALRTKVVASVS